VSCVVTDADHAGLVVWGELDPLVVFSIFFRLCCLPSVNNKFQKRGGKVEVRDEPGEEAENARTGKEEDLHGTELRTESLVAAGRKVRTIEAIVKVLIGISFGCALGLGLGLGTFEVEADTDRSEPHL
jgi:hypothetical protein